MKPHTKPSNIPWLGQVPEHWEVKRLGDHMRVVNGFPFDAKLFGHDDGWPLIRVRDVLAGRTETYWQGEVVPEAQIEDGDLLVGMDGDFHVGIWAGGQAMLNQRVCCLRTFPTLDKRYLRYLLPYPIKVINDLTYATTVKHLSSSDVAKIRFPLPPLPEQRAIATYLDARTARIDGLVARQRRLVQLLKEKRQALITRAVTRGLNPNAKMKDSGVPWLGEVPVGWTLRPLKQLVAEPITDGPHETPEFHDEGVPFVSAEAVWDGRIHLESIRGHITRDDNERYSKKYFPRRNDIYIVKSGSTTGRVAIVDFDTEFNIWSPLAAIRCNDQLSHYRFIYHALASDYFQKQVQTRWSFGTQPNIGMNVIGNLLVALPPRREQQELADYIDSHAIHLDTLVTKIEQAIERLQEYRTALISAAVTGKVRVPQ